MNAADRSGGIQPGTGGPRLLDSIREVMRARHYSRRTEESYLHWMKRFIIFSGKRHPRELGVAEVSAAIARSLCATARAAKIASRCCRNR